jgi:Flp pilus assembly protein TadG
LTLSDIPRLLGKIDAYLEASGLTARENSTNKIDGNGSKSRDLLCEEIMARSLRIFWRDHRANIAVMFALTAPILVVFVGMGIDYLVGLSFKSRWDTAADAAAIAAVKAAEAYVTANASNQSTAALISGAKAAGNTQGGKAFDANAGASETAGTVTRTVDTENPSGTTFTATVSYTGTSPSHFGRWVGISNLAVAGSATASAAMTTYINYYIILDTSESMGVGSSATDMQNLFSRTEAYGNATDGEPGCVLACHVTTVNNNGSHQTYSNEYLAHNISPTITLRIDAAKSAIQDVITQAVGTTGNIQIGLYTMQSYSQGGTANPKIGPYINTISNPTSDFSTLGTLLGTIDLASPDPEYGWGNSAFTDSLDYFNNDIFNNAALGNGFTAQTPLNYVFIITDGVQDVQGATCFWQHCTQALDPSLCNQFKTVATVGVIYTTYLPFYQNNNSANGYDTLYGGIVEPISSQIAPNLQSCATSSQYYYEATDGPALTTAMSALFTSSAQNLRLTQ